MDEEHELDYAITDYTCYDCPNRPACEFAFDLYNVHGDCLAEK